MDVGDLAGIIRRVRDQAAQLAVRVTAHAHVEMVEENISFEDVLQTLDSGRVMENYPEHKRGACCLISGRTEGNRPFARGLHQRPARARHYHRV